MKINQTPCFQPDYRMLISRSDLCHQGRISFGPHGMPIGGGRLGGPVWQPDTQTLAMQLNHTDFFLYNDASAQSTPDGGGLGRIDIDFGSTVFGAETTQKLQLYDGALQISSAAVSITAIADTQKEAILLQITDHRESPKNLTVSLRMLRKAVVQRGLFSAISRFSNDADAMLLEQEISESCTTGIRENDHFCHSALAIRVNSRTCQPEIEREESCRLVIPAGNQPITIQIGGSVTLDADQDVRAYALSCIKPVEFNAVFAASRDWWHNYWQKSYVYLPDHLTFEQRRTYYFYLAAIGGRGRFPAKYNGSIWIAEGDRRDWGCWYWNWNQDSLFQPFETANHGELLDPLFTFRERCFAQYQMAAQQLWGCESRDALFIGETSGILGAETLPEEIAEDLRKYYAGEGDLTKRLRDFGEARNGFLVPWNYKLSEGPVSYVTHTMVATQETAEYFWQRYLYTGDLQWLRAHAYPFIKGAAELYRTYYGFRKEEDGRYHFNRTNLHEHIWGGRDVIDDLSLSRGTFAAAIKAAELLDLDPELQAAWQECLENLAPYPMSHEPDAIGYTVDHRSGNPTWCQGRHPAALTRAMDGSESPQFKMLEKYDILNLETRAQNRDHGDWETALHTFYDAPGYQNQYLHSIPDENGSSRFLEDAAKLGRAKELEVMFHTQFQMFRNTPNLLHDQGDYYSAEGYGAWAAAIQQALHQTLAPATGEDPVIHVFPAWPRSWNAKYRLLAKGGFLVSSSMQDGQIEYVEITSQLGGICCIRNPWNANVRLLRSSTEETIVSSMNDLLQFETKAGESVVLIQMDGTNP